MKSSLYKRFTPAGPDHAQVAACAGMADYMDAVYAHHFPAEATAAQRAAKVHDLFRDHEARLAQPILDYLSSKNSVHLIGPAQAKDRAPTISVQLPIPGEMAAEKLAPFRRYGGGW